MFFLRKYKKIHNFRSRKKNTIQFRVVPSLQTNFRNKKTILKTSFKLGLESGIKNDISMFDLDYLLNKKNLISTNFFFVERYKNSSKVPEVINSQKRFVGLQLIANTTTEITWNQVEAIRKVIRRVTKKKGILIQHFPKSNFFTTKKTLHSRMGKGVGRITKEQIYIQRNQQIISYYCLNSNINTAKVAFAAAKAKLGLDCFIKTI